MPRASSFEPLPPRPGASNPLSMIPLTVSGGYVHGTEIEITFRPASLSSFQNDGAFRCPPLTNSRSYVPAAAA